MEKGTLVITNDFINATKRKVFESEYFIAHYPNHDYFRLFIDREDGRRQVITFNRERFEDFKNKINSI